MKTIDKVRCAVAVVLPVAVIAAALMVADAPHVRYGLRLGPCFKEIVYEQSEPIDFVAVGGSRMLTAFDPYLFERAYRSAHGREVVAYNLARSWFGPDYAYPMLRDLLERRRVGHLLVMASYQRGDVYNPLAYSISKNHDLLAAFDARPHDRIEHLSAWLRMLMLRVRDVLLGRPDRFEPPAGTRTCYTGDRSTNPGELRRAQSKVVKLGGFRQVEFDIANPSQEYALFYYRRIVELARAHGTKVTFVRMPLLAGPRWSDKTAKQFEEAVGAPLVRLPIALRVQLVASGYRDRMHLIGPGRELFLPWLVEAIHTAS